MSCEAFTFQGWGSSLCRVPMQQRRRRISRCTEHTEQMQDKCMVTTTRSLQLWKAYPSTSRLSFTTNAMPHNGLISEPASYASSIALASFNTCTTEQRNHPTPFESPGMSAEVAGLAA